MNKKILFILPLIALTLGGCKSTPKEKGYTVTWLDYNGVILEVDSDVKKGSMPSFDKDLPTRESDDQYNYTFKEWLPALTEVTQDVTYRATYNGEKRQYTVNWVNEDGTPLLSETYAYGDMPQYTGDQPQKAGTPQYSYYFDTWYPEITRVTGNATYTATFTQVTNYYVITWKNWDGRTIKTDIMAPYGSMPSYSGQTPTKPSDETHDYTFSGWLPEFTPVTGNQTYTAQFAESDRKYTIQFVNVDDEVISTQQLEYGATVTVPNDPTYTEDNLNDYYFSGWDKEITTVNGDATYKATYVITPLVFTLHNDHYSVKLKSKQYQGEVTIPSTWNNLPVSELDEGGFANANKITKVVIPSSISNIPDEEFIGCTNLRDLTLNEGLSIIGESAFEGCHNLHELEFPSSITEIKNGAFKDCKRLYSIIFPTNASASMLTGDCFIGSYSIAYIWFRNGSSFSIGSGSSYSCFTSGLSEKHASFNYVKPNYENAATTIYMTETNSDDITAVSYDTATGSELVIRGNVYIKQYAFRECVEISDAYIDDDVIMLGMYSFYCEDHVLTIHYDGTKEQLSNLNRASTWMNREKTTIICSDGIYEGEY